MAVWVGVFVPGRLDELKKVGGEGRGRSDGRGFFRIALSDAVEEVGLIPFHDGFTEFRRRVALVVVGPQDAFKEDAGTAVGEGGIFPVVVFPVFFHFAFEGGGIVKFQPVGASIQ